MPASPVTVAMYSKSHQQIAPRLDALGLDIDLLLFDETMTLTRAGSKRWSRPRPKSTISGSAPN